MILAIVQARVGSERFPGKVLEPIEGVPMLAHVLRRVKAAQFPTYRVLAIPDTPENDPLVAIGESEGFEVYRGSELDVLARFYWASQLHPDAKIIVRITADDPCKDPALIDLACELFMVEWADPNKQTHPPAYLHLGGVYWALGMDVEVFTREALHYAHQGAVLAEEREHVTPFMARLLGTWTLRDPQERATIATRLTVDTPEDMARIRAIYAVLREKGLGLSYDDILATGLV